MKLYLEIKDDVNNEKSQEILRQLIQLEKNGVRIDIGKDPTEDMGEFPNYTILMLDGNFSIDFIKEACSNIKSDRNKIDIFYGTEFNVPPDTDLKIVYYQKNKEDTKMVSHCESCVKITHLPTGLTTMYESHRSRAKNMEEAKNFLALKLKVCNFHEVNT